eukprot:5202019-Prorocentrum_lima.AAC.1
MAVRKQTTLAYCSRSRMRTDMWEEWLGTARRRGAPLTATPSCRRTPRSLSTSASRRARSRG